jgi:GNAT superfamily N-acetyltransferase
MKSPRRWKLSDREPVMESMLELQLLTPVDWRVLKAARLGALRDSPHAFMSCFDNEWGLSELEWRRMFESATWIVAREAGDLVGLARSVREPSRPRVRHLESIWVAPTHRRRGVLRALLAALAEREESDGVTDLLLWLLEDNHEAQRAYETLGFVPTGERQFLPVVGRFERRLRLGIRYLPAS